MLYPFTVTLDLHIQAENLADAKKLAEAYVQDLALDTQYYPEVVQDDMQVASYNVLDIND